MEYYWLFCGSDYYPEGGWRDFKRAYATLDEAIKAGNEYRKERVTYGWYHIVVDGVIIEASRG